jgi:hypothetical protein
VIIGNYWRYEADQGYVAVNTFLRRIHNRRMLQKADKYESSVVGLCAIATINRANTFLSLSVA